jgi:hypothetical protein
MMLTTARLLGVSREKPSGERFLNVLVDLADLAEPFYIHNISPHQCRASAELTRHVANERDPTHLHL